MLGISIGLVLLGNFRFHSGVIEVHGRAVAAVLSNLPVPARALTMGHVVFGQDDLDLQLTRKHERVHVAQYERWGPMFVPAYVLSSLLLYAKGRDGYRENPFEVEAYAIDDPGRISRR